MRSGIICFPAISTQKYLFIIKREILHLHPHLLFILYFLIMPLSLGINGFGRIGRLVCRAALENPDATVVAVNDPFLDINYAAYQFKYDSVHGTYPGDVTVEGDCLNIGGTKVKFFACRDPAEIPWGAVGAEIVCESTGVFTKIDKVCLCLCSCC